MRLSKNFSLSEFEHSDTAIKNKVINRANTEQRKNLQALVDNVLQPICDATGWRGVVSSGFRNPETNRLVGGVPGSQHTKGQAADIKFYLERANSDTMQTDVGGNKTPKARFLSSKEVADRVDGLGVPYDQMILYPTFVHLSYSNNPRGQRLNAKTYKL